MENKKKKIKKDLVLCFQSDQAGCGHIRCAFPMNYINSIYGKKGIFRPIVTPAYIYQKDLLIKSRSIYFQRMMNKNNYKMVTQYKKQQKSFKYKMVYEIDDYIWDWNEVQGGDELSGIPIYNNSSDRVKEEHKFYSLKIMEEMDTVITTTKYLKNYIEQHLENKNVNVRILPNVIPKYLFGYRPRGPIKEDIQKPKILYSGSPTHYSNLKKMNGDFLDEWIKYIKDSVNKNKIDFTIMGGCPYFFEDIKDKIQFYDWVNSYDYPRLLKYINADFIISPLVANKFNSSKSNLRFLESAAIGVPQIGVTFSNGFESPYDNNILKISDKATAKEINDYIEQYYNKNKYNTVMKQQYDYLDKNDCYVESRGYIRKIMEIM